MNDLLKEGKAMNGILFEYRHVFDFNDVRSRHRGLTCFVGTRKARKKYLRAARKNGIDVKEMMKRLKPYQRVGTYLDPGTNAKVFGYIFDQIIKNGRRK